MIVIFHRGYLGFQPEEVSGEVSYSFTEPKLANFIADGILNIPISGDVLNPNDLGNEGTICNQYKISNKIYYRHLHWDINGGGPEDMIYSKNRVDELGSNLVFRCIPLNTPNNTSAVLNQDSIDGQYITALIHADATLEQIDSFCQEFQIGSAKPFLWTTIKDVYKEIEFSKLLPVKFPYNEIRTGPSKHIPLSVVDVKPKRGRPPLKKKKSTTRR